MTVPAPTHRGPVRRDGAGQDLPQGRPAAADAARRRRQTSPWRTPWSTWARRAPRTFRDRAAHLRRARPRGVLPLNCGNHQLENAARDLGGPARAPGTAPRATARWRAVGLGRLSTPAAEPAREAALTTGEGRSAMPVRGRPAAHGSSAVTVAGVAVSAWPSLCSTACSTARSAAPSTAPRQPGAAAPGPSQRGEPPVGLAEQRHGGGHGTMRTTVASTRIATASPGRASSTTAPGWRRKLRTRRP